MKRQLLSFALFLFSFTVLRAQWVSIPDTNFGTWLNTNGYSACMQGNNAIGWQMDTTCPAVVNETYIYCWYNGIRNVSGIQYFDNLDTLYLTNSPLYSWQALPRQLKYLDCRNDSLSALPPLPASLRTLNCYQNQLTSLPALPVGLWELGADENFLTSLPTLPVTLKMLTCGRNSLSVLPALPDSIWLLDCTANLLTVLPTLPAQLDNLICNVNQLTSLPALPGQLEYLWCQRNQLTALPALPATIRELYCGDNHITVLPSLQGLQQLFCSLNQLTALPPLPGSLTGLGVDRNNIDSLPAIPFGLTELWCSDNPLGELPTLPSTIEYLLCENTQISSLPPLPATMQAFHCDSNPQLFCLPHFEYVGSLSFAATGISCIPNYFSYNSSYPLIDTMPLCDLFNIGGCPAYWNVGGRTYFDADSNCQFNTGDVNTNLVPVSLLLGNTLLQSALTSNGGHYSFDTDSFTTYTVVADTSALPFTLVCPWNGQSQSYITALDSLDDSQDFAFKCKPGFDVAAMSVFGRFRPGLLRKVNVRAGDLANFYGAHCADGLGGTVQLTINGPAHYAVPLGLTPLVSGNTLTWNVADFGAVNVLGDFNIMVQVDSSAQLGQQLCFTLMVTPTAGDNNPANNTINVCMALVNAVDPNEKEVSPVSAVDTSQKWLTYTINFQNTGNAEAMHIYIDDTLDSNIDPNSFQLLAYSHQPVVQLRGNLVRFNFPAINLPDSSSNEPASHGYVQYKVKLKNGLPLGTQIKNTAYIYFDFNAPVVTNTTTNTIAIVSGIVLADNDPLHFVVYPNPASTSVTVSIPEELLNSTLSITDITGREIFNRAVSMQNLKFDIQNLSNGIYFVSIRKNGVLSSQKLVVSR